MQRVYTRKQPLNLRSVKKSAARLKDAGAREVHSFEASVPRVGSREFPQAPRSVREENFYQTKREIERGERDVSDILRTPSPARPMTAVQF